MAEFLTTPEVNERLNRIIENAKKCLVLISPYLSVNDRLKQRIEARASSGVSVQTIYRHLEQKPDVSDWLESLPSIKTSFCENLHAKCYLNESEVLLTSMNLYEFSQDRNYEMGVFVSNSTSRDRRLYREVIHGVKQILDASIVVHEPEPPPLNAPPSTMTAVGSMLQRLGGALKGDGDTVPDDDASVTSQSIVNEQFVETPAAIGQPTKTRGTRSGSKRDSDKTTVASLTPKEGFCIRCKCTIPANPTRPYCGRCFKSWNRYKKDTYEEKYCHLCGKEHIATMSKPACLSCYRKYRNVLEFAAS